MTKPREYLCQSGSCQNTFTSASVTITLPPEKSVRLCSTECGVVWLYRRHLEKKHYPYVEVQVRVAAMAHVADLEVR